MSATPWILAMQSPLGYWCRRCDLRLPIGLPVEVDAYLAAGRAFIAEHAGCAPLPAAAEMERAGSERLPGLDGES